MFMFFLDQHDKNLRFIEFGDTLTFAIESYEDLSQKHNKGVVFKKEVFNENELPVNDNSKKISISAGSYVIVFIFILISIVLCSGNYKHICYKSKADKQCKCNHPQPKNPRHCTLCHQLLQHQLNRSAHPYGCFPYDIQEV